MLRKLEEKDAPFMLEWMHDPRVGAKLAADFEHMTLEDCLRFIKQSAAEEPNLNRAVCGEDGEYLGTISLKNIDKKNSNAEYAVCMRSKAHGTGMALSATDDILDIAFHTLGLHRVYLCVFAKNERAVNFYKKYGFVYEGTFREHGISKENPGAYNDTLWFSILKSEYEEKMAKRKSR